LFASNAKKLLANYKTTAITCSITCCIIKQDDNGFHHCTLITKQGNRRQQISHLRIRFKDVETQTVHNNCI